MIDADMLDKLQYIKIRTGMSTSEQVRQGIQWWLESREWPARRDRSDTAGTSASGGPREPSVVKRSKER